MREELKAWAERYRRTLCDDVMPFWMNNGLDREYGGVYTCLDRDGSLIDPTKSVWFQGRFAYVCSLAYNEVEQKEEWLLAAESTLRFVEEHCFDERGRMYFEVANDGTPIRRRRYLFSECFAAIAMAEFARATGKREWADKAVDLFLRIQSAMGDAKLSPPKYESSLRTIGHSLVMILVNVALCLKKVSDHPALDRQILESADLLTKNFLHPEFKALLETVGPDGEFIDTCMGRTINPGHAIETSWFLMEASLLPSAPARLGEIALTIFDWSFDWGWDEQYGGIINFRDCRNLPHQDYSQDMKFWWPQCEAVIASLAAYRQTGDEKYLERWRMVNKWAFDHFADERYGEWYGYLHRDGTVAQSAKGNIFKGPFHLPRMLILAEKLCREVCG